MAQSGNRIFYGWYVAGGSFSALFLAYSVIYSSGTFLTPLSETFGSGRASTAGLFAIAMSVPFILGTATGPLADRIGPRPLVMAGGVLIGAGLVIASRAQALWQVYAAYSLGVGLGAAAIRVPATEVVERWFVRRRGAASGMAVAGVGAGNLVGPLLAVSLLRLVDWRTVFVVFGVAAVAGIVFAAALLSALGAGSLAGRFLFGGLADRIGRRPALILAFAVAALFLLWWLRASQVWSLAVFAAGYGTAHGGLAALSPALATDYFGTRHAGAIIGVLFASWAPGSLIGPILAGLTFDARHRYTLPILASAAAMIIATACAQFLPDPEPEVAPGSVSLTGATS